MRRKSFVNEGPILDARTGLRLVVEAHLNGIVLVDGWNVHRWDRQPAIQHILPVHVSEELVFLEFVGIAVGAQSMPRVAV